MKRQMTVGGLMLAAQIWGIASAVAGPWEDGMAAYNRGDYVPAVRVFRAMAEQGNAKAQSVLGVMYRRGQGVSRSPVRAFLWFSRAAARGDVKAKTELREVSETMTPDELVAGARDGAGLRGVELPQLRVLTLAVTPGRLYWTSDVQWLLPHGRKMF